MGRNSKFETKLQATLSFRVTETLNQRLNAVANKYGLELSSLLFNLLSELDIEALDKAALDVVGRLKVKHMQESAENLYIQRKRAQMVVDHIDAEFARRNTSGEHFGEI